MEHRLDGKTNRLSLSKRKDTWAAWSFLVPASLFLFVTSFLPLLYSAYLSFFRFKMNLPKAVPLFIGLENYARVFTDSQLATSALNTLVFALASVSVEMALGLMVALAISGDGKINRVALAIFIVPMIMAPVAAGTLWRMMLDSATGVVNYLLSLLGISGVSWLANTTTAMVSVIFVNIWQLTPWVTVVVAAGLKALPQDCIQAALVDGATPFQVFRRIVLPLIMPLLTVILMIRFIDAFKVFDTVYVMTGGGPGLATEMLPNFIYKQGLKYFDAGYAGAMAVLFVLAMTLVVLLFVKWRSWEEAKL
ncbi:MAG: sugar ABC transporter permease [Clostridiales bacterium]|nr:sugar ABC transporter permease [Clostridiales bacterium]